MACGLNPSLPAGYGLLLYSGQSPVTLFTSDHWGGEIAAAELTGYLKPERYTVYTDKLPGKLIYKFKFQKDPHGNIEILTPFWTFKWNLAEKRYVPPLLIYADLMATGDARAIEAAEIIYDNYLARLIRKDR